MMLFKSMSGECGLGLGSVCLLSRKRILSRSNSVEVTSNDFNCKTPMKRRCRDVVVEADSTVKSSLEALPQEILLKILCGVDHDDLKQLFHVSRLIRDSTIFVKASHFAYTTPSKTSAFRGSIDLKNPDKFHDDDFEVPNAPKQVRVPRSRIGNKKLADISVALFASEAAERWPRKKLFKESED
ncbi:hypothetical protein Nepgr_032163 [Nepenthes gracilis]|uniref:F-box domain-containing protein n=1 Tax=Nepenthes gracilis TaxID=150966 RepID=A0AAD3TI40_NEPGR|nr:hypothetical protein Nepgr_032163 [Nepenthes gracilis]